MYSGTLQIPCSGTCSVVMPCSNFDPLLRFWHRRFWHLESELSWVICTRRIGAVGGASPPIWTLLEQVAQEHWLNVRAARTECLATWLFGVSWVMFPRRILLGRGRQRRYPVRVTFIGNNRLKETMSRSIRQLTLRFINCNAYTYAPTRRCLDFND